MSDPAQPNPQHHPAQHAVTAKAAQRAVPVQHEMTREEIQARNEHLKVIYDKAVLGTVVNEDKFNADEKWAEHAGKEENRRREVAEAVKPDYIRDAHTAANAASIPPGGVLVAAGLDLGAGVAEFKNAMRNPDKSTLDVLAGVGNTLFNMGADLIPAGGGVALKGAIGITNGTLSGDGCKAIQDFRNAVVRGSDTKPCRNFNQEALDAVTTHLKNGQEVETAGNMPDKKALATPGKSAKNTEIVRGGG